MSVALVGTSLRGAIERASLSLDAASHWTATANSTITLAGAVRMAQINARSGVTISAVAGSSSTPAGSYPLSGGGMLNISSH